MYERIPEIMTLQECCMLLKVGKNTMLDMLHDGRIQGFKIGSRWKIPKESVVEFIRYGQTEQNTPKFQNVLKYGGTAKTVELFSLL